MKKVIVSGVCIILLITALVIWIMTLDGSGSPRTAIKDTDNEYFKTKIVKEDENCMILQNEVTGEYFIFVGERYWAILTSIEVKEE